MKRVPVYWGRAKRILSKRDPVLRKIIKKHKRGFLTTKMIPFFHYAELLLVNKFLLKPQIQFGLSLKKSVKNALFLKPY